MKLTGKVSQVSRTVAKRHAGGAVDEKRMFQINARPACELRNGAYGYGALNFTLHGRELTDFGCDLGDDVEIFVVRQGVEYAHRHVENISSLLYETEGRLTGLQAKLDVVNANDRRVSQQLTVATERGRALQIENVRLTTELETLRAASAEMRANFNMRQIGPS